MAFISSEQYFQLVEQGVLDLHSAVSGYSCACGTCGVSTATATAIDGQASGDLSNAIQANALAGNATPQLAGEAPISLLVFDTNLNDVDQNIDALMNVYSGTNSSYWTSPNLTFSFPDAATDYTYTPSTGVMSGQLSTLQMSMVRTSLAGFASVSNLAFTELASGSADGTLRFVEGGTTISTAFGYYPNSQESGGDVWMNSTAYDSPVIGNYSFHTFMHEIGHALGLKHGHETNGPGALASGVDSMEYSIMTYRSFVGHDLTALPYYTNGNTSYAQSLMMYDIATIQRFYGADFTTNGDNSVYTFSQTTGEMSINGTGQGTPAGNKVFRTIWDGGGVDTYDLSNYTTALNIDLTPGGYTNFDTSASGNFQRAVLDAGFGSSTVYARGNVFNALQYQNDGRSLIENANGGSGSDTITGNAADNFLRGNGGSDTLYGGAGNDILQGDAGVDALVGGAGSDTVSYRSHTGTVMLNLMAQNSWDGTAMDFYDSIENAIGSNFNDSLTGNDGDNILEGLNGVDSIIGNGGSDTVSYRSHGGTVMLNLMAQNSWDGTAMDFYSSIENAIGSNFNDSLNGSDGDNILEGLGGVDSIIGNGGSDTVSYRSHTGTVMLNLMAQNAWDGTAMDFYSSIENAIGSEFNDSLNGSDGDNILEGLSGVDSIIGNGGGDTVSYRSNTLGVTVLLNSQNAWDGASMDFYSSIENAIGSSLNDSLNGSATDNTFEGLGGADTFTGNGGNDIFRYVSSGTGTDTITDFDSDAVGGQDLIDLSGRGFTAASLGGAIVISGTTTAVISIGTDTITLNGVASSTISATDFIF